jgi:hypothetical protein
LRLQLLGARLLKHGKNSFQGLDLDGQPCRLKRPPLLGLSRDDQDG